MNRKSPLIVAGIIFLLVGVLHALRVGFAWPVEVNGMSIPISVSVAGALVAFLLSIWMFRASR